MFVDLDKLNITTGDYKLDTEHAQIFSILSKLQETTLSQTTRISICEKLLYYISNHCRDEEKLMNSYEYPDMFTHIEDHHKVQDSFIRSLSPFIKTGGVNVGLEIRQIFYKHIVEYDLPMIAFIQEKQGNIT